MPAALFVRWGVLSVNDPFGHSQSYPSRAEDSLQSETAKERRKRTTPHLTINNRGRVLTIATAMSYGIMPSCNVTRGAFCHCS